MPRRTDSPNPLTLADMREQGISSVSPDCPCGRNDDINVDHLPGTLPVPDVRHHIRCACGQRPVRTIPAWQQSTVKRPGYTV